MESERALRRARRQINDGYVVVRGVDPLGRRHDRSRTLDRLEFLIEATAETKALIAEVERIGVPSDDLVTR